MSIPTVLVDIGFSAPTTGTYLHLDDTSRGLLDTATLAPDDLFADVSTYVASVSTRRGATRSDGPNLRYESGTASGALRNDDRRFDPTNLDGPYVVAGVTQVEPMRAVRFRATWDGVTYPLWRGFSDDWQVAYDGPNSSYVTLTCVDAFAVFASYDRDASAAIGAGEDSGVRIGRILDSVGWPAMDRVIAVGDSTLQATTLADNTLSELHLTADSELGEFYIDPQGRTLFRNRLAQFEDLRSTRPNAVFGDEVTEGVDTTVNMATNPSVETDLTGWEGGGFANPPTVTRDSTRARFGVWSVLGTWSTASGGDLPQIQYTATGLTPGRTYTVSVYAYVPTGSPSVALLITPGQWGDNSTGDVVDEWVRLTWTGTASTSTLLVQVWPHNSTTTVGQQVWLDGLQVEEGGSATTYVDGSTTETVASDDFDRSASNGLGTATTGQVWTTSGGSAADYSANGAGHIALTSVNVSRRATLGVSETDVTVSATISVDAVATGAPIRVGVPMRIVDAFTDHTRAQINLETGGALTVSVVRRVAGADTTVATASLSDTYTAGTLVRVIAQVTGTTWRAMVWTTTPPATWSISTTDGTHTLSGPVGIRALLAIGNTNGTVNATVDDVTVSTEDPLVEWDGTAHASTSRRLPELPYANVTLTYDRQSIYNLISIARVGGTAQVVEDSASRDAYLTKTHQRHDLLLETDAEALDYAGFLLGQSSQPELRCSVLELKPRRDERLWPQALGREIGDRIKVIRRPPGGGDPIEREVVIRGIEHEMTAEQDWTTRFVLQSATRFAFMVLDNPSLGALDSNSLAY